MKKNLFQSQFGLKSFILRCSLVTLSMVGLNLHAQTISKGTVAPTQRLSFDKAWLFHKGQIPLSEIGGHSSSYNYCKAGAAIGAAGKNYDDSDWRIVDLPHDWAIEGKVDSTARLAHGYHPRGWGWYRKNFRLDLSDKGKHLEIQLDGIATHCTVWVNGIVVHRNWCGYTSMYIDITAIANYGDLLNNIAIQVDAEDIEGWWYEGAGIYRHTWLVKREPVHIVTDGVYANPVRNASCKWNIPVEVNVENIALDAKSVEVVSVLTDPQNRVVAKGQSTVEVAALNTTIAHFPIAIEKDPKLWSVENPTLYTVSTTVKVDGKIVDELSTRCGFRYFRFDPDSGFYMNDKHLKIKGVCNHIDHAGVGVAMPDALWGFRLRKIKEMGANAYRCSHNPPSKEFLNLCDSVGILVMDENRNFNASPEYLRQLEWMVRRDRNHPSIILWSVFNEEPMQGTEQGYEMVRRMSAEVKKLDTSRPVTAAMSDGFNSLKSVAYAVDVAGFNYQINEYDRFHKANPTIPLTSSEDASGVMVRDNYATNHSKHLLDAYDTQHPSWGATHRTAWKAIDTRPYLAGCFIWTGFDYHGEPSPYTWPTISSNFGILDLCGFPKTAFWLHQAQWIQDKDILHLVPYWNWPADSIGKPIKVMAFSNADKVKLVLNGKVIGEKQNDIYEMLSWEVPYQPGKLEAFGYKNGKQVSHFAVETTTQAVALQLVPDRNVLNNDGQDAMPITVRVVDAKGRPITVCNDMVEFEISGSGKNIGVGNGNPNSHELEKANQRSLFNGLAQVIVQSIEGGTSNIILTAKVKGLKSATISLGIHAVEPIQSVPVEDANARFMSLTKWSQSPESAERPDPLMKVADNDMNSWVTVSAGQLVSVGAGKYTVFRCGFTPYKIHQKNGGAVLFKNICGLAEVWLDDKKLAEKTNAEPANLRIELPLGTGKKMTLNVLIKNAQGTKVGFGGDVRVCGK